MKFGALHIADLDEVIEYGAPRPRPRRRHLHALPDPQASISVDQSTLGTKVDNATNVTSFTITTSAAAAAGSLIVVGFGTFTNPGTITGWTASGGGLTWFVPVAQTGTNTDVVGLAYALAPSGLASGTVITLTMTGGDNFSASCGVASSFTGVTSSSPDGTSSKTYAGITSGVYTGNTVSIAGSSDLIIASAWGDGQTATTNSATAASGWTQGPIASQGGTTGGVVTLIWQLNVSSSGTPGGTWGAGAPTGTAVVAAGFLGGPPPPPVQSNFPLKMKARY